jgi:hypothetical protein
MTPESVIAPHDVEDAKGIDAAFQVEDLQVEDIIQVELFRSALREALAEEAAQEAVAAGQLPAVQSFSG